MPREHFLLNRVFSVSALVLAVLLQAWVTPGAAATYAAAFPGKAYLEGPYVAGVVVSVAFFELAVLGFWRAATVIYRTGTSVRIAGAGHRSADVVAVGLGMAGLVVIGLCVHAGFVEGVGGPGVLLGLSVGIGITAAGLLARAMLVSRMPEHTRRPLVPA